MPPPRAPLPSGLLLLLLATPLTAADFHDPNADRTALPTVPPGFTLTVFARDPLVRQPCAMAFDARGRLHVGMGPQYRNPQPKTPGDQVVMVLDEDGDGQADRTRVFARGFNAIQGLAWRGRDLWVANAPDLTVVRDLDGDDVADEYVRVYTDLGNLEHGLHGLNWAPDGKLYMSKGNSKGLTQPGRIAPRPFRELWGVTAPPDAPDFPAPRTFTAANYEKAYHDPADDWGREGGILRCDDGGRNLEVVARGCRNPWDIAFDSGFHWLGTDNDQTTGDRVFMAFPGAHLGWNHPWSSHWSEQPHAPTAPVSGPLWEGSGTGIVFADAPGFPASHRGVFLINDWLGKTTYMWRPRWDGALLRPDGAWEPFVRGGRALYRPTDLAFGPEGSLYILGWGSGYGAEYRNGEWISEGRIFRVTPTGAGGRPAPEPKRNRPLQDWSVAELLADFDAPLPVWRTDAQEELVRRGAAVRPALLAALDGPAASETRETWTAWTLGRLLPAEQALDDGFAARAADPAARLNLRLQALRILAHRAQEARDGRTLPAAVTAALRDPAARVRFEAVQALQRARQGSATPALLDLAAREPDPTTFYAAWQTLRALTSPAARQPWLSDPRGGVRRAALLALLEDHALQPAEVRPLGQDPDEGVRAVAALWLRKSAEGGETAQLRGRPLQADPPPATAVPGPLARAARTRQGSPYPLIPAGLRAGARPYFDRNYALKQVPPALEGLDLIQAANKDDGSRGDGWLTFEALLPARVHVGLDARARVPGWLGQGWREEDAPVLADHWKFRMFTRDFPAGPVSLGGNTDDGKAGGKGSYIVALAPRPLTPPAAPTRLDDALAQLPRGDRDRGAWLFHRTGGAGCFQCHRLEGHGNAFGPDLAGVGDRATARHLLESMLNPNAVITEGFQLQEVTTTDAEHAGILLEESGLSLTLGLANGQRLVLPKTRITGRRSGTTSAMPAYDALLTPTRAADLASYLLAQKAAAAVPTTATAASPAAPRPPAWPAGEGFRVRTDAERLVLAHSGKPVGEFIFRDARILRPYFANLHTPDGVPVTRTHPPVPGVDATDHDTMHPGLWLAFGSLGGVDFWRNQGRIEHMRFAVPASDPGPGQPLAFVTDSQLRAPDGRLLGWMTNRLTVSARPGAWQIEWDATLWSGTEDLLFGDQEEMGLGARLATALTEKNGGRITSSAGRTGARQTWGQPADWCDYSGVAGGRPAGITLIPHRDNFRGSWWHNRDYGVFVANPFGRAALKQGEPSRVTVRRGEPFRLRFTAVLHGARAE